MIVDNKVKQYFNDACEILDSLDIEYGPISRITVNNRAKSRWGRCSYKTTTGKYEIEISSYLLENGSYDAIMDTMVHELLHAHKKRMCHTGEWKKCANLVNDCYSNFNIKRCTTAAEKNLENIRPTKNYKYEIICNSCGTTNKYMKRSKVVNLIMKKPVGTCECSVCGGNAFTLKYL